MHDFGTSYPIAQESLRYPLEEGEQIDWWCCAEFIDPRPEFDNLVQPLSPGSFDGWCSNAVYWGILVRLLSGKTHYDLTAALTDAHNDTVAESFEMENPIVRSLNHVME